MCKILVWKEKLSKKKKKKKKSHLKLILTLDECSSQNERPNEKMLDEISETFYSPYWLVHNNNTW